MLKLGYCLAISECTAASAAAYCASERRISKRFWGWRRVHVGPRELGFIEARDGNTNGGLQSGLGVGGLALSRAGATCVFEASIRARSTSSLVISPTDNTCS